MTVTHGLSRTHPLYSRWKGMRARCNNPHHAAYTRYGARGIGVCGRWDDFTLFLDDMAGTWPGPGYELHRLDSDGDYAPSNCVWVQSGPHRALPKSPEHRGKIGDAHKGRRHLTDEQYAVIGEGKRARLDPDWLREAYEQRGLSIYAIAAEAGCGKSSVSRALRRLGITIRSRP